MSSDIPQSIIRLIQGRRWYHQRFDGSPLYMHTIGEAEVAKEKRKPDGTEAWVRVWFCQDGKADWYLDMADIKRGAQILVRLAKSNKNLSIKLLSAWKKDEINFKKFFDHFQSINLSKMCDGDLVKLYRKFHNLSFRRFTSSAVIDHFALGTDQLIASLLKKEVGQQKSQSNFTDIFSKATAPVCQSFINKAEMELLQIAIRHPKNLIAIKKYQRKYFWIRNNYTNSNILSVDYFKKEIGRWLKSKTDLKYKYDQLKNTAKVNKQTKSAILKKYKFSRSLLTLLKISEDFTWWQDERKKATYLNIYMGDTILSEMARRKKIPKVLTRFLLLNEVQNFFNTGVPSVGELKLRQKGVAVIVWGDGNFIAHSARVAKIRNIMFPVNKKDNVMDIRGLTASVGRVSGRVKIVGSVREINKVKNGDILVSVMTRPDYIAGIKKAAAIVTNEGGITCHAAIVARELGIPCIIGTKIATEVLKDGDLVEVNANHGVVTILKKNN
ncbi:MAG: PEP-utilizing enzyme [Patescibacteria group bacterium]